MRLKKYRPKRYTYYYSHLESRYQRHGEHRQYEHRQDPGVAPQQGERGRGVLVDTGVRRSRRDDHARRRRERGRQQEHVRVHPHPSAATGHLYNAGCRFHVIVARSPSHLLTVKSSG